MAVTLCMRVHAIDPEDIAAVLAALAERNERLYRTMLRRGGSAPSPFDLIWHPDQLIDCDSTGCSLVDTSVLHDAVLLHKRGYGSCGELSCAYAGYLAAVQGQNATIELISTGAGKWHVVAHANGRTYDPAHMNEGKVQHAAQ